MLKTIIERNMVALASHLTFKKIWKQWSYWSRKFFSNPPLYNKTKLESIGTFDNPVIIFIDDFDTENRGQFLSSNLSFFESQILRCSSACDILIQAIEKTLTNKNLETAKYIQIICDRCFLDSIAIYNANM